jgi:hypothetical protein
MIAIEISALGEVFLGVSTDGYAVLGHYDFNTWTPLVTTGRETIEQILALGPREAFARARDRILRSKP